MTTVAKLRSLAKSSLTPYMTAMGFVLGSGFAYRRQRPSGIWDVVYVEVYAGGSMARSFVSCYVGEMYEEFLPEKLPKGYGFPCGGLLSPDGINYAWDCPVESVEEAEIFLTKLVHVIERVGLPYFASVSTRQDFWNHLSERLKGLDRVANRKDRIISS